MKAQGSRDRTRTQESSKRVPSERGSDLFRKLRPESTADASEFQPRPSTGELGSWERILESPGIECPRKRPETTRCSSDRRHEKAATTVDKLEIIRQDGTPIMPSRFRHRNDSQLSASSMLSRTVRARNEVEKANILRKRSERTGASSHKNRGIPRCFQSDGALCH